MKKLVLALSLFLLLSVGLAKATDISNCTDITESGTYYLTNDVNATANAPCISILADDVHLDCQGYDIYAMTSYHANGRGIYANGVSNLTVKNCNIYSKSSYTHGVLFQYVDNSTLQNNTFNNGAYISVSNSNNLVIENNTVVNPVTRGALFEYLTNSLLQNNIFNGTADDLMMHSSFHNVFKNNQFIGSDDNIVMSSCGDNTGCGNVYETILDINPNPAGSNDISKDSCVAEPPFPLEGKTLILQFKKISGDLMNANLSIECRTCNTSSNYQIVQYWENTTDCDLLETQLGNIIDFNYPITLISLDSDFCNNYTIVTSMTGFSYQGSMKSMDNRDKFVFHNSSRSDQSQQYVDYSDVLSLQVVWDGGIGQTKATDKNGNNKATSNKVYVISTVISNTKATFYIANNHTSTIWVNEIRMPNHLKYQYLQSLSALYTTHAGQNIPLNAVYLSATDEVKITAVNGRIPIEPATGSNSLVIEGLPIAPFLTSTMLGTVMGAGFILYLIGQFLSVETLDVKKIVELVIVALIMLTAIVLVISMFP